MKQFYEAYAGNEFVSPLVTQIQWANYLIILSRTKSILEKIFYLQACIKDKYTKRELEHQISACLFERTVTEQPKLSKALQDIYPAAAKIFHDSYTLDFLGSQEGGGTKNLSQEMLSILIVNKSTKFFEIL